jgi:hypothetical protein
MKFIIVDNRTGKHRSFTANSLVLGLTIAGLLGIPALTGYLSYQHGLGDAGLNNQLVDRWRDVLKAQQEDIKSTKTVAQESLEASAVRLAQLQARIVRLDALGERLTRVAKLEEGEFDFSQPPALGGPLKESVSGNSDLPDYMQLLDQLGTDIESREQQLSVLETLLVSRKMQLRVNGPGIAASTLQVKTAQVSLQ